MRLTPLSVLVSGIAAAGLIPAGTIENPAPPTQEIVAVQQATGEFVPSSHDPIRIVLADASLATTLNTDGTPKCLPKDMEVLVPPSAVTRTANTVQIDYGTWENVQAVIAGDQTAGTAFMPSLASYTNEVGAPDIEFHPGFVAGSELTVKLCVPWPAISSPTR